MMVVLETIWLTTYEIPSPEICIIAPRKNILLIPELPVFGGIPTNLLLNVIGFMCLVVLFGFLRKKAWNYGRLALLNKTDHRWMELFYGDNEATTEADSVIEASMNSQLSHIDRGFISWIATTFRITDEELLRRAGPDGLLYISFQRSLIILTSIMTIASLAVALPINYNGTMRDSNDTFSLTTLSNLDPMSSWMWVHVMIILSYLPIGSCIMAKFLKQVRDTRPAGLLAARTLIIGEIPKHQCTVEIITEFFKNAFPRLIVQDISVAYDIKRLVALDEQRNRAEQARLCCENYNKRNVALKLYSHTGINVFECCCKSVDALEHYTSEEIRLTALAEEEKNAALRRPLGVAFVTLETSGAATMLRRQLRYSPKIKWSVNYSPIPSDIFWENLSIPRPCWYFIATTINSILFVILFFLTTPMTIVTTLYKLPIFPEIKNLSPLISSFLPTVMLVAVAALMPVLVASSESLIRHRTRSGLNSAIMRKTLLLLLLMVLILPSLGLTSVQAFLDWQNIKSNTRWECIFLADQGAFFVNYVITAALTGCAIELIRFPELAVYTYRLCIIRSRAEQGYVRKAVLREFPLSANYAWLLLVFTMTTVYSMPCPLITPFGLLYMLIKHFIDRHNLCFAYRPRVGGGTLGQTAARATGVAPVLAQAAFLALRLIRRGWSPLTIIQFIGLVLSITVLVIVAMSSTPRPRARVLRQNLGIGKQFIAPVLRKKYRNFIKDEISVVVSNTKMVQGTQINKNYGTIG